MRRSLSLAVLFLLALSQSSAWASTTLRNVLTASGIPVRGMEASDLDRKITSYATLDAQEEFIIAYYPDDGTGLLGEKLYVALYRKRPSQWITRQFGRDAEGGDQQSLFGGAVVGILKSGDCFLIHTHVNPSAGLTLVVDTDLNYRDTLYGWAVAVFPDGLIVYQHSEVHFAPTHYVEMSVYDPRNKKHWQIYPQKPYQAVRQQQVEKVRAAYQRRGEAWFHEHNHHGDPELFDNYLQGEVAAKGDTHSLAFVIAFDNTDTWDYAEKLKLQNFGALGHALADFKLSGEPPDAIFEVLGQGLQAVRKANLQNAFLELFRADPELQEMIRKALAGAADAQKDWRRQWATIDPRWGQPEVWRKIQRTLATPPETTEVVCVFRALDQEQKWEFREIILSDFQKKFGDRPLNEYLDAGILSRIFAH